MRKIALALFLSVAFCFGLICVVSAANVWVDDPFGGHWEWTDAPETGAPTLTPTPTPMPTPTPGTTQTPEPAPSNTPSSPDMPQHPSYNVGAPASTPNGKVTISSTAAKRGDTVTITATPDDGYKVDSVTVVDAEAKKVSVTDLGKGKYSFVMPDGKVTVNATFVADTPTVDFTDLVEGAYYYDAVLWAVEKGITNGTGDGKFSPNATCTRAQIVTFLWRANGSPEVTVSNTFSDVPADSYYAQAVAWAVEKGITNGTGDGKFSPSATCTRAQAVTFLHRAEGTPAASADGFSDVDSGVYYAAAVSWAVSKGVTNGTGSNMFSPGNTCTRGQIVTFLYRAANPA